MNERGELLLDLPLAPDPDAEQEMGPGEAETITDEEARDCRLLLVRRAAEPAQLKGATGGVVALQCVFHPASGARFTRARLSLRLTAPADARIVDLQPRLQSGEPVKIVVNSEGRLGFNYEIAEAEAGRSKETEFEIKHCAIQGSGENTTLARWDFTEDPVRKDGIVREQTLALTLPVIGLVQGTVNLSARLARPGLRGKLDAVRDLALGAPLGERQYPISFEIPPAPQGVLSGLFQFITG
jgi:hypothetical protein